MTRDSEASLLDFCARQKSAFQESSWLDSRLVSAEEMATVCLFLAGVDWYGHKQSLIRLAQSFLPSPLPSFESLVQSVHFDCLRFSNMLKRRLLHA
ncbi:hypothetical protein EI77_04520 [Prosthecobacter fusiformis]|uniref:Uncharacterized protein n=1 Tax=Prosthecobacter fusiformis TaxID=48464 RepID=A0A4R7RIH2_9BACT|nr:hypothetical protein EI77_04520 [Prosthecobacter fusiformis]